MGGCGCGSGKGKISFPNDKSQIKHIFRKAKGHLPDTIMNRAIITKIANDIKNYLGTDKYGNQWYAKTLKNGGQIWVRVRNGIINNAGFNNPPKSWDPDTGLNANPFK